MIPGLLGRKTLLSKREQELRARERELLERLEAALERVEVGIEESDAKHLAAARTQLDQLFLIVVAGEFNSGKSSFVNALLGERLLPEGVTPTTDRINLLRWGAEVGESAKEAFLLERTHPAELLRELNVVDTPGTNAVIRRHEELTREFLPRADLLLFITSADRPFTESERTFLEQVGEWGKKIVVVVNKIDLLGREEERKEVLEFVTRHAAELLDREPEVFPVSAREGLRALPGHGADEEGVAEDDGAPDEEAPHDEAAWQAFDDRLAANFPSLFATLMPLYQGRYDFLWHLEQMLVTVARCRLARPADLLALDARREAEPDWYLSNQQLGAVCYVDLFAGTLAGLRERIGYFKLLGVTYLHLMPVFKVPEGDNDGGYAVRSYRKVKEDLGTMEELLEVLTWAQLGVHGEPCGVLNVEGYFDRLIGFFDHAVDEGFLRPVHRDLVIVEDEPEPLLDALAGYEAPRVPQWISPEAT